MLLETSSICTRPVTIYNNFGKYNGNKCLFVRDLGDKVDIIIYLPTMIMEY